MFKSITNVISLFHNNAITFVITLLLYMNCGFFITFSKNGSILSAVSPQYIFFYIALIYTIFYCIVKKKLTICIQSILGLITVTYIIMSQFLLVNGRVIAIFGDVVSILFFVIGSILLQKLNFKQIKFIADTTILYSLIIFLFDTIYKLINCSHNLIYMFFNYRVKDSILYPDTNTLGIQITILLSLSFVLYKITHQKWYIIVMLIFSFLAFCTFSRAAVIAILLIFIYEIIKRSIVIIFNKVHTYKRYIISIKKIISYFVLLSSILIVTFSTVKLLTYLANDWSFFSKIEIFKDTIHFILNAPCYDVLFGIGFNNGRINEYSDTMGYAHTYLATYIMETGLIVFILYTVFLLSIFLKNKLTIYVLIPFLIFAFSYFGHTHLQVFYSVLILEAFLERLIHYPRSIYV